MPDDVQSDEAWVGCGKKEGLEIWRIVNFKVEKWPVKDYGSFYTGDSYIVLYTYKDGSELCYNLHFWIGKKSTQDEYGTAAYKTAELDQYLEDIPVQYREVEGHESKQFQDYFTVFKVMKGGAPTGFKKVEAVDYEKRLFHIKGEKKRMSTKEVTCVRANLDKNDVFVLDLGLELHQWNGADASVKEKMAACEFIRKIIEERPKAKKIIHEGADMRKGDEFYDRNFPRDGDKDLPEEFKFDKVKKLFRISDESGKATFTKVGEGKITMDMLDSNDSFLFDVGQYIFVYLGKDASRTERTQGIKMGDEYLRMKNNHYINIIIVKEGQLTKDCSKVFKGYFD